MLFKSHLYKPTLSVAEGTPLLQLAAVAQLLLSPPIHVLNAV